MLVERHSQRCLVMLLLALPDGEHAECSDGGGDDSDDESGRYKLLFTEQH